MGIYEPGTCCLASVKILEESCRDVAGSNTPKGYKSLQAFLSSLALQGSHVGHGSFVYITMNPAVLSHSCAFPWLRM